MITDEKRLYPLLIDAANKNGCALYRLEDAGSNKKPFDIGGCWKDGRGVALEVKLSETKQLPDTPKLHLLRSHQIRWLTGYSNRGGIALFIIYFNLLETFQVWRLTKTEEGKTEYVLTVLEFKDLASWSETLL